MPKYGSFIDFLLCCCAVLALCIPPRIARIFVSLLAVTVAFGVKTWLAKTSLLFGLWWERVSLAAHLSATTLLASYPPLTILIGMAFLARELWLIQRDGASAVWKRLRETAYFLLALAGLLLIFFTYYWFEMQKQFALDTEGKGLSFAISGEATSTMTLKFQQEHLIRYPDLASHLLVKSNENPKYTDFGWYSTFAPFMFCDPKTGTSSEMTFAISKQQSLGVILAFATSGNGCRLSALVSALPHYDGADFNFITAANSRNRIIC
jgi:hypothetical protein